MKELPPMPEVAAWILKSEINKYPNISEADVAKRSKNRILTRRGGKGQFLTTSTQYWMAKLQGGGGVGKNSTLPLGHTTMDKQQSWREGFHTSGDPVIIPERDYPGLELEEIASLFAAQSILLYRTETRGSNIGPDISALEDTEPLTAINIGANANLDILTEQRKKRESYANNVLRSIKHSIPESKAIRFNNSRGRIHGLHTVNFGIGTEVVGLGLELPKPNAPTNLVAINVENVELTSRKALFLQTVELSELIAREMQTVTLACTKGKQTVIYIGGGALGGISYNDVYDKLAQLGKLVGHAAPNSVISFKDIAFKKMGIKVSRESFTRRNEDVLQLPLSLDIYPAKEKTSMNRAYQGSQELGMEFGQSGLSITPIGDATLFDPNFDDHPSIVQYRMNQLVPTVIEFLRTARVAPPALDVEPLLVEPSNLWKKMRAENAKIKEIKQEELESVIDAFSIVKGHEVAIEYENGQATMHMSNELSLTGIPQTNDFEQYCMAEGIKAVAVKGILCPTDGNSYGLVDDALKIEEITTDITETLNIFMPLEAQIYGAIEGESFSKIRGLAYPHAKIARNISTESGGTNFAELINDELDTGYATRILLELPDGVEKNLYSEQVLDAAIIGYDLDGKNPSNGIIGKVIIALLSREKIRVEKGGRMRTINAEIYNPIGVVGAFAGFEIDAKREILQHLMNHSTHPDYEDGYIMVNPEDANMVVRVMHKGIQTVKPQKRYRLITTMKPYKGQKPTWRTTADMNVERLDYGGTPEVVPGNTQLVSMEIDDLPTLRAPTITAIVSKVDGFEEHFIEKEDKYSSRWSEQSEKLTFKAPIEQLPIKNAPSREYPGGDAQYMMDGILLGSLTHISADGKKRNTLANWQQKYPELAARLEEAKNRGWTVVMPNPPEFPDSKKESEIVLEKMKDPDLEYFKLTDKSPYPAFKEYLNEHSLEYEREALTKIINDTQAFIMKQKNHYNRPRPAEVNSNIKPEKSETADSPAYPSGHAFQSYLIADFLSDLYPEHRNGFYAIAKRISDSRVSVGLHYPSDNEKAIDLINELLVPQPIENPPTDNWSAHRQRVPWDFAPNAFGRGSAFRTFKMDDKTSRRKAIHMDGWNRRYDKYKGVQAIAGRLLNGKWHIQSIRVPRKYKLRRTLKEVRLDRKRPPKWYKELHPQAKPFGTKKNPPGGFNVVLSADPQEWSAELDLVTQGFDLLGSWFPSTVDFTERFRANIETDFRAGDFATLTEYLTSDYWKEIRDLIIIHDGKYHHSRGGLGFGQTASTSDKSYAAASFSLPFLRRFPSVLPIIHETGHLIGATQRDFEIDDGHHCTNDCIMTDDATINYMEWDERLRNEGRWNKDMFCNTCIAHIESKNNPIPDEDFPPTIFLQNLKITPELDEALRHSADLAVRTNREILVIKPDLSLYWFQQLHQQMLESGNFDNLSAQTPESYFLTIAAEDLEHNLRNSPNIREAVKKFTVASIPPPTEEERNPPKPKKNPIMPRNAIAAMDEGWTGYPTWAISPTISMSNLQGNPPKEHRISHTVKGKELGFLTYFKYKNNNFIEEFSVSPRHRDKGIGKKLLNEYIKKYPKTTTILLAGAQPSWFWKSGLDQKQLEGFYEKYGFVKIGEIDEEGPFFQRNPPLKIITSDIITISGPSGAGKSAIARGLKKKIGRSARVVPSYMTRKRRPKEEEGKDGIFITKKKFKEMIKRGNFTTSNGTDLWVLQNNGHYYGRRAEDFERSGVAIVDVSFKGLELMREAFPGKTYSVLVKTRMGEERRRKLLQNRGIHTDEEIERRVKIGTMMMQKENYEKYNFDFFAANRLGELEKNVAMIASEFRKSMKENPPKEPPTLEEFREWVDLVNMKNKELKAFMDSDWFKISGLTPQEAEEQGIKSGQDSFRAIIRMRKKLGLRGPKDYIKSGPRITKKFYEMALEKWNGPDSSVSSNDDLTDWGWMKRQIRFNNRASAFPYNQAEEKRKGPLVKKQKTQNQPSRRLLSLWVWGHDPWRWARKNGIENMPKCPDVPWVGMTEKRKYGKVPVLMGPKSNPMAPGYQSFSWISQDWRAVKVNNKGEIDYSEKCGAEGTQTKSGKPRLCLPRKVIQTLLRTESGKEVLRQQARKKARAKKGERIPWHPRIKKLHAKLEKETVQDNPPVFESPTAMDMGIQYGDITGPSPEGKEGSSKWHNQLIDGKMSDLPLKAEAWKKRSFRAEMGMHSLEHEDGTRTIGFVERFAEDTRPYTVSLKIDGDSSLVHFDGKQSVVWNKRGRWRRNFHITDQITASLKKKGVKSAQILGELYAVGEDGMALRLNEISSIIVSPKTQERQDSIRFAGFDLLELNGKDFSETPYEERVSKLIGLLEGEAIMVVPFYQSKGGMKEVEQAWEEGMKEPNFEGLVLRFEGEPKSYKIKMKGTADLAVFGFYRGKTTETGRDKDRVGGGVLAWMLPNGDFVYAGRSVIGKSLKEKDELLELLLKDSVDAPLIKLRGRTVDNSITHDPKGRGTITMVTPKMVGEFKYRGINWSEKPVFRFTKGKVEVVGKMEAPTMFQASFHRWREDKGVNPHDLRMEQIPVEGTGKWGHIKTNPSMRIKPVTEKKWTANSSYPFDNRMFEIPNIMVWPKWHTIKDLRDNPDHIFLFGDNQARKGKKGQAQIRGMKNAMGVRTKRIPSTTPSSFLADKNYQSNLKMMKEDFLMAIEAVPKGGTLVFPKDGLGTGLAELPQRAPKTYLWLKEFSEMLTSLDDTPLNRAEVQI